MWNKKKATNKLQPAQGTQESGKTDANNTDKPAGARRRRRSRRSSANQENNASKIASENTAVTAVNESKPTPVTDSNKPVA